MKKIENLDCISILNKKQMKEVKGGDGPVDTIEVSLGKRPMTSKELACANKQWGEACSWEYEGKTYYGRCSSNIFAPYMYCSDLNLHY